MSEEIKEMDSAPKNIRQPRKRLILWFSLLVLGIVIVIIYYVISSENKNHTNDQKEPDKTIAIDSIDNHIYKTVKIGNQVWMSENLKTTRLNDGTVITLITDSSVWGNLKTPAYCWYDNDEATYKTAYGALYNWYAVNTGKLCPTGWHVPSSAEWETLAYYLGHDSVAVEGLKETGTSHWASPNTGATNKSGFTALPGGLRKPGMAFEGVGDQGNWWSSTGSNAYDASYAMYQSIDRNYYYHYINDAPKAVGFSVRCIKDND